jgi:DNA polymerase-1
MLLQVHDELIFEVPEDIVEPFRSSIIEKMSTAVELSVPIKVESGVAQNWRSAH